MSGALSHLRVLDLSRVLAGPWATQILADLGAEVIKIERPGAGDDTRGWGPPFLKDAGGEDTGESAYYLAANRNKKSMTIDIAEPDGQAVIRQLAQVSDVLVENFKVGGLRHYGLDYESLKEANPRLIYCSITGFGQTGPYAARAGYDFLIQAMSGLMSLTGRKTDEPGGGPQKVGVAVADLLTGLYAVAGILAALAHRDKTGFGQHVDLALLDVQIACLANQTMNYLIGGQAPVPLGNAHPNIVPYEDFPTSDGAMIIAVGNDAQFERLCRHLGQADIAADPRYRHNRDRVVNRSALIAALRRLTVQKTTAEWVDGLEAAGVPCGPINTLREVFADPQVRARGVEIALPHRLAGTVPLVANPIKLSATPIAYRTAPPLLGENTGEILTGLLGMEAAQVTALAARGII